MHTLDKLSGDFRSPVVPGAVAGDPDPRDWLAALIDGSDDAIISKTLDGVIQSWNGGATRLFGYAAAEAIGKPIAMLIPEERLATDSAVLARIRHGNRVERLETQRRRKDGALVDISLTVSAIRNAEGVIVGASIIARDITERLRAEAQQRLLMGEMRHRVKNLFALAAAIVSISAKSAGSDCDVIDDIRKRLWSLARAHEMTMTDRAPDAGQRQAPLLVTLIGRILDPYAGNGRVTIGGRDCDVGGKAVPYLSLLLHELATNAAKYGALSATAGHLDVTVDASGDMVRLIWRETGGPAPLVGGAPGFGSLLERSITTALSATIERDWRPAGLVATITVPRAILAT